MTENEGEVGTGFGRVALVALALAVLALAAYAPIFGGGYQFLNVDDDEYVTENPFVQAGLTRPSLWWALTKYHSHNWHPLTWMSLQLDWQLYGANPLGYHITNVVLHVANTILLFFALRSLTGAVWRSAVVAAFFAVHPLHVESVAWVAERKDVLSTLFWTLTLWAYSSYAARPSWGRYLLTLASFALGLMAKPMLVTLPCVLLLLDYWPLRRLDVGQGWGRPLLASGRQRVKEKLPFFALAAGCCWLTLRAKQDIVASLDYLPLSYRLGNVPLAYLRYIAIMFWPVRLAVFYPHPGANLSFGLAAAAAGLLLAFTILALWQWRRCPYLMVGWFWYLGTLVPVIGLVQTARQAIADRYTYIPLIGLFLMLAWGVYDLVGRRLWAWIATPVVAGLLAFCVVLTWRQLPVWRDSEVLWQHALAVRPSSIAHEGMARFLEKEGHIDEARDEYAEAIRYDPCGMAYYKVGVFLVRHGKLDEALEHFGQSLAMNPNQAPIYYHMGFILLEQGKLDESRRHLAEVVRLDPNFAGGHYLLGLVLERQGKFREAEVELTRALRGNPGSANARFHLGVVFGGQGRWRDAVECFVAALHINPNHVEAQTSLGALLAREGETEAGLRFLRAALGRDPQNGRAHFNLGLALELDGKDDEACRQFAEALKEAPNDAEAHQRLAAVLGRQGKVKEARLHQAAAARIPSRSAASGNSDQPLREQFRVMPSAISPR